MPETISTLDPFVSCPRCKSDNAYVEGDWGWGTVDTIVGVRAVCPDCGSKTSWEGELDDG